MPKTRMPSISSDVAIGRRIKGSEMLIGDCSGSADGNGTMRCSGSSGRSRGGGGLDPGAVGQSVLALDDDLLAGREPLRNDGDAVLYRPDVDRPAFHRAVLPDDIGAIAIRAG